LVGLHVTAAELLVGCFALVIFIIPIVIGFAYILPDASRRGQPGLLWALLTIPFNWTAVLVYVIVRSVQRPEVPR
jgi:hypothetical protein